MASRAAWGHVNIFGSQDGPELTGRNGSRLRGRAHIFTVTPSPLPHPGFSRASTATCPLVSLVWAARSLGHIVTLPPAGDSSASPAMDDHRAPRTG